jgi:hypothetical protein
MAKDPAFLFYPADFYMGTVTMTDEQVGKYLRLLILQFQKLRLTEQDMSYICKTYDKDIYSKFTKEDDLFYNKRLDEEIIKRRNYSKSRSDNRKTTPKETYDKHMIKISKSYDNHMENENENRNDNKVKVIKHKHGEYSHVLLTDEEYNKLKTEVPDYEKWIKELDEGIELKDYKYKSHYLAIKKWMKNESKFSTHEDKEEKKLRERQEMVKEIIRKAQENQDNEK